MMICRVTGAVVSTHKNKHIAGYKILVVQPLDLHKNPAGNDLLAVDKADAGIGDLVLVMREGGSARKVLNNKETPVQAVIVGVIDDYNFQST